MIIIYDSRGILTVNCLYYDSRAVNYYHRALYNTAQRSTKREKLSEHWVGISSKDNVKTNGSNVSLRQSECSASIDS